LRESRKEKVRKRKTARIRGPSPPPPKRRKGRGSFKTQRGGIILACKKTPRGDVERTGKPLCIITLPKLSRGKGGRERRFISKEDLPVDLESLFSYG